MGVSEVLPGEWQNVDWDSGLGALWGWAAAAASLTLAVLSLAVAAAVLALGGAWEGSLRDLGAHLRIWERQLADVCHSGETLRWLREGGLAGLQRGSSGRPHGHAPPLPKGPAPSSYLHLSLLDHLRPNRGHVPDAAFY